MDYDAIVVGSGFGGTIAATKLAAQGHKTLILERGTWWISPDRLGQPPPGTSLRDWLQQHTDTQPAQFWARPDHKEGLLDLFAAIRHRGNHQGLYQFSMFDDVNILTSSAVGGGSMIYANVTIRPDPAVLAHIGLGLGDPEYQAAYAWMADYRGPLNRIVTKIPLPGADVTDLKGNDYLYLDRSRVLKEAAAVVSQQRGQPLPWAPLELSVIDYDPDREQSAAAKAHTFCERQGRCILGCLPQARQTLNKSIYGRLLNPPPAAPRPDVTLAPLAEVRQLRRIDGGYTLTYLDHLHDGRPRQVSAPVVFLAGGTLGTTELLLRSRDDEQGGLRLSDRVGTGFSTNGDFGAFAVGTTRPVYSTRGPVNTCHVPVVEDGIHITVEDCAIPSMFAAVAAAGLQVVDHVVHREVFFRRLRAAWAGHVWPDLREFLPHLHLPTTHDGDAFRTEAEMVANTFFFNVMGQDDANGTFSLEHDHLELHWPKHKPVAEQPVFRTIERLVQQFVAAMGGDYVPLWSVLPGRRLTITHPLGGCPIGTSRDTGVVDEQGRVFDAAAEDPTATHQGLYVVDGSVIPGALAVNPSLTISAQALKTVTAALTPPANP